MATTAIFGAGVMGETLLSGLLRSGRDSSDLVITERNRVRPTHPHRPAAPRTGGPSGSANRMLADVTAMRQVLGAAVKGYRVLGRTGRVLADRYHHRILTCPRQVRNALAYVLLNARRHAGRRRAANLVPAPRLAAVRPARSERDSGRTRSLASRRAGDARHPTSSARPAASRVHLAGTRTPIHPNPAGKCRAPPRRSLDGPQCTTPCFRTRPSSSSK